jgi:hypothetical protein
MVLPLLISAVVAPLVLLRSDQSVALGVKWFLSWEHETDNETDTEIISRVNLAGGIGAFAVASLILVLTLVSFVATYQGSGLLEFFYIVGAIFYGLIALGILFFPLQILFVALTIRIVATAIYLRSGLTALSRNFRRLVLCTSPAQAPDLVPGLNVTNSRFTFLQMHLVMDRDEPSWTGRIILLALLPLSIILYLPAWLYRITVKSTAWFWWPLAFLGGDLKRVQDPDQFKWDVMGSLWAKTSIALAVLSLVAFAAAHLGPLVFAPNELLVPMARLLLIDWSSLWSWQVCALLASVLSIAIVYLVDDVSWRYRHAKRRNDAKLLEAATSKYGRIERLTRFRFLLLLAFWGLVGTHAFLYANSQQCWFSLSPALQGWAQEIYGDRLPQSDKCPQ